MHMGSYMLYGKYKGNFFFFIIKVKHLNTCVLSLCEYQGVINLKYVSCFKALHQLATTHFVVFVDSEGAGEAVAVEEE